MFFKRELFSPQELKEMYPLSEAGAKKKKENDEEIRAVLEGRSEKMLLIVGPCSADREDSVIDYISRLAEIRGQVSDAFVIVPRLYTNKPRTTGIGYKGMLHQPDPLEDPDLFAGLTAIRKLHLRALEEYGFSCADEMLYPENHMFLWDLLSYVSVGARSVECQLHRMVASGLDIPVGMKNPTSGDLSVMLNSIVAAQASQNFIYRNWEVQTKGNKLCHAILRGYVDKFGNPHPNYHYEELEQLASSYGKTNLANPAVIIDCNHSNSGKKYYEQPRIAMDIIHTITSNPHIKAMVKGLMIESYIEDGNQNPGDGCYGKSITDACLGWEKTKALILELAAILSL